MNQFYTILSPNIYTDVPGSPVVMILPSNAGMGSVLIGAVDPLALQPRIQA